MDDLGKVSESLRVAFAASPLRIAIAITVICLLLGALIAYSAVVTRRQKKNRRQRSDAFHAELKGRHALLPSEEEIIGRMVGTIATMNRRHLLLTDQALFDACAQRLNKAGKASTSEISQLRMKLDFPAEGKAKESSSKFPLQAGYPIEIRSPQGLMRAHVFDTQSASLRVRLDADGHDAFFLPDSEVDIEYRNWRGAFVLHSAVISQDGELLCLSKNTQVARMNRRIRSLRKLDAPVGHAPSGSG